MVVVEQVGHPVGVPVMGAVIVVEDSGRSGDGVVGAEASTPTAPTGVGLHPDGRGGGLPLALGSCGGGSGDHQPLPTTVGAVGVVAKGGRAVGCGGSWLAEVAHRVVDKW